MANMVILAMITSVDTEAHIFWSNKATQIFLLAQPVFSSQNSPVGFLPTDASFQ